MIILCAGMYRSGSTLQYQITSKLIEKKKLGVRVEWKEINSLISFLGELNDNSFKVVKTHEINDDLISFIKNNLDNVKIIYIYRDLRDVFLSHLIKNNTTFEEVYQSGFIDHCINLYDKWMSLSNVYVSKYEDVVNNIKSEVKSISEFLNMNCSDNELIEIANNYSFKKQKDRITRINKDSIQTYGNLKFDPKNLLHHNHLNKGEIGGWRTYFTSSQIQLLNAKVEVWSTNLNYEI